MPQGRRYTHPSIHKKKKKYCKKDAHPSITKKKKYCKKGNLKTCNQINNIFWPVATDDMIVLSGYQIQNKLGISNSTTINI